jgi:glycosyltransferase involved in cell wall biosynthesis
MRVVEVPTAPVSAIIPCYRCAATIQRAVLSVARQTVRPAELILVDDASGDGTLAVLEQLAESYRGWIKVVPLPANQGPASARNRGWATATQPYIAFLDADDAWHPQKIEIQYGLLVQHPEYGLVGHAHVRQGSEEHAWLDLVPGAPARSVAKKQALFSNPFATPTVMLRRGLPFRFTEGKRYAEDYLLWLQMILGGVPAAYIDQPLAATYKDDFGAAGLSAQLWAMEKGELGTYWQLYREGKIGCCLLLWCTTFSLAKYIRRVLVVGCNC